MVLGLRKGLKVFLVVYNILIVKITSIIPIPVTRRRVLNRHNKWNSINNSFTETSSSSTTTSIELSNYYNNEFVGRIGVGTPPQYLTVIFDTGSSDIWFPSSECKVCSHHTLFQSSKSSTYNKNAIGETIVSNQSFQIEYGSGEVTGKVAWETIHLGSLSLPVTPIGLVTKEDSAISNFEMDGICGLAFSGLSVVTIPPLISLLFTYYPNISQSFSFYLSPDPDLSTQSLIIFGGYNLSLVSNTAQFNYAPILRSSRAYTYWTIGMYKFQICNENSIDSIDDLTQQYSTCSERSPCLTIVDSGTSGIGIPSIYYTKVLAIIIAGMECKALTCINVSADDFPVILLYIKPDNVLPLLPSDYVECNKIHKVCIVRIQETTELWIFGDVFLQAYYTHFDVENLRLGFACDGQCQGGSWHGVGGNDFIFDGLLPSWQRGLLMVAVFGLLVSLYLYGISFVKSYCVPDNNLDAYHEQLYFGKFTKSAYSYNTVEENDMDLPSSSPIVVSAMPDIQSYPFADSTDL